MNNKKISKKISTMKRWNVASSITSVIAMVAMVWGFFHPFLVIAGNGPVGATKDIIIAIALVVGGAVLFVLSNRIETNSAKKLKKLRHQKAVAAYMAAVSVGYTEGYADGYARRAADKYVDKIIRVKPEGPTVVEPEGPTLVR